LAFEIEVSASLARCIAIAFDLATLALIARPELISRGPQEKLGAPMQWKEANGGEIYSCLPGNRNITVPLGPGMCGSVTIRTIAFSLLSAPISVRGTLRTF